MGSTESLIVETLREQLDPDWLSIENESHKHAVPKDSETHFRLIMVSAAFDGKRAVQRHQMVYKALDLVMGSPVHALAMHLFSSGEYRADPARIADLNPSPPCLGGSN